MRHILCRLKVSESPTAAWVHHPWKFISRSDTSSRKLTLQILAAVKVLLLLEQEHDTRQRPSPNCLTVCRVWKGNTLIISKIGTVVLSLPPSCTRDI
jgi:hypothetical protein